MQIGALSELAIVHKNIKNYRKALNILYQVISMEKENPKQLREQKYLTMAQIYRRINQPDSAIYLLQKALSSPNPLTKRGSFTTLFYLYKEKEMYQEAANYLEKGWILNDSIQKTERDKALIEMQEKYNQQKLINLKNNLELEKNRIIQLIYVCLIITAIIIGYLIYLHQKKMLQKERLIQEAKEEIATKSILIKENENTISRNETRIIALTREIEKNKEQQEFIIEQENALLEIKQLNLNLKTENNILQQEVNNASIILKRNSKEIKQLELLSKENQHLHEREYFLTSLLIRKNETFNKVIIKHQYIEEHQWIEIIREINYLFDNYTDRLIKLVPTLTESDIQICCLIKLHIKNSTIASLLAISPTSVTKRKVRLKERLIQTIGTFGNSQTLELWLREF